MSRMNPEEKRQADNDSQDKQWDAGLGARIDGLRSAAGQAGARAADLDARIRYTAATREEPLEQQWNRATSDALKRINALATTLYAPHKHRWEMGVILLDWRHLSKTLAQAKELLGEIVRHVTPLRDRRDKASKRGFGWQFRYVTPEERDGISDLFEVAWQRQKEEVAKIEAELAPIDAVAKAVSWLVVLLERR